MASVHASCVAIDGFGVLLRGPSGAGKTDLALRLMDDGSSRNPVTLVADDRVVLEAVEGQVRAWAPRRLRGFMEVAGLGIVPVPACRSVRLGLVVDLVERSEVEPVPPPEALRTRVEGCVLPRVALHAFDVSAAARVRLAVACIRRNDWNPEAWQGLDMC